MSIEGQLQTAIYSKLQALSVPVYSNGAVPDNDVARYAVIGDDTHIQWDTDGRTGFESTVVIHTWDTTAANRSQLPIKNVMGEVYNLLHRAELTLISYDSIGLDFEFSETFIDPDGLTRHGVQRFRVFTRA